MISIKLIKVLFLVTTVLLSMTPLIIWSGTFVDDFNDNKNDGWKELGIKWKIKDRGYHSTNPNGVEGVALIGDPGWGPNYSVEVKVRDTKGVWLGIHLRWVDIDNHYDWWVDLASKKAGIYIKKGPILKKLWMIFLWI